MVKKVGYIGRSAEKKGKKMGAQKTPISKKMGAPKKNGRLMGANKKK